jgi:hypothetical protein
MVQFYSRKKLIFLIALVILCLTIKKSISYAAIPPTGYTGGPGENNCTSCHSGTSLNGGSFGNKFQVLTNMPNGRYGFSTTYQITVRLVTPNCVRFGFESTFLNSSNATVGSTTVTNSSRTQKQFSGSREYISHTQSGTNAIYTDSTEWTFNWTSPPTNVGTVSLYIAGNVTNNDNNSTKDTIYTKTFSFSPYTPPQGSISTLATNFCLGDSVRFVGGGTNSPTGFNWTFPGGIPSTSTQQVVWVHFPNTGTAVCSLYVSNSSGTSSLVTKNITMNAIPSATITVAGSTIFCQGDSLLLTANTGTGYSYLWYLDGISTSLTGDSLFAKSGGNYTVKVTGPGGCNTISAAKSITVNPTPYATITAGGPLSFCTGDSVLLRVSTLAGATKEWYNGASLLTGVTDTIYYVKSTGNYLVKTKTSAGCSSSSNTVSINVNPYPTASFTSASSGCTFMLTANSGTGYRFLWFRNDTALINDTAVNYLINSNGMYKVRVTNAGGCFAFSTTQTVNITNLPDVTLTLSGSPVFCAGDSCTISVPKNSSFIYHWYKNGNILPNDTLEKITVKDSGTYLVKVSNLTCTNTSNATVIKVLSFPDASINVMNNPFCAGDSAVLTANSNPGYSYQWYRNDTLLSGKTAASLIVKASGNYNVNVSNDHCNQNGNKILVKANPLPATPLITRNQQTLSSTAAVSYQWFMNGVLIPGAVSQSYTPAQDAKYSVAIKDINGCANISGEYNFKLVGISSAAACLNIKVYPIPASESLTVETPNEENISISIFDLHGKKVHEQIIANGKAKIDISTWASGVYILKAEGGGKRSMLRVMVSR